jgi:hypothetical protein
MMRLARQNSEVHSAHAALGLARTTQLHVITQYLDHTHIAIRGSANPGLHSEVIRATNLELTARDLDLAVSYSSVLYIYHSTDSCNQLSGNDRASPHHMKR